MKRIFFLIRGLVTAVLGVVSIPLPLPTTLLFTLSAFCFANVSEKFSNWLCGTKLYRKYIEPIVERKNDKNEKNKS